MVPLCALQRGEIEFEVVYVAPEVDSDDENVEYEDDGGHRYRLYLDELEEGSGAGRNNGTGEALQGERPFPLEGARANVPPQPDPETVQPS